MRKVLSEEALTKLHGLFKERINFGMSLGIIRIPIN